MFSRKKCIVPVLKDILKDMLRENRDEIFKIISKDKETMDETLKCGISRKFLFDNLNVATLCELYLILSPPSSTSQMDEMFSWTYFSHFIALQKSDLWSISLTKRFSEIHRNITPQNISFWDATIKAYFHTFFIAYQFISPWKCESFFSILMSLVLSIESEVQSERENDNLMERAEKPNETSRLFFGKKMEEIMCLFYVELLQISEFCITLNRNLGTNWKNHRSFDNLFSMERKEHRKLEKMDVDGEGGNMEVGRIAKERTKNEYFIHFYHLFDKDLFIRKDHIYLLLKISELRERDAKDPFCVSFGAFTESSSEKEEKTSKEIEAIYPWEKLATERSICIPLALELKEGGTLFLWKNRGRNGCELVKVCLPIFFACVSPKCLRAVRLECTVRPNIKGVL